MHLGEVAATQDGLRGEGKKPLTRDPVDGDTRHRKCIAGSLAALGATMIGAVACRTTEARPRYTIRWSLASGGTQIISFCSPRKKDMQAYEVDQIGG